MSAWHCMLTGRPKCLDPQMCCGPDIWRPKVAPAECREPRPGQKYWRNRCLNCGGPIVDHLPKSSRFRVWLRRAFLMERS